MSAVAADVHAGRRDYAPGTWRFGGIERGELGRGAAGVRDPELQAKGNGHSQGGQERLSGNARLPMGAVSTSFRATAPSGSATAVPSAGNDRTGQKCT